VHRDVLPATHFGSTGLLRATVRYTRWIISILEQCDKPHAPSTW
jgi:hypothetical protein